MDLLSKRIEKCANAAIIVVAVLLGLVLINNHLIERTHSDQKELSSDSTPPKQVSGYKTVSSQSFLLGSKLTLPDIEWPRDDQTLVLALSNTCRFCTESATFYQQLIRERGNVRTIAVLPQAVGESRKYLGGLNVRVDHIKQMTLQSIGVEGTPTLILLDRNGAVLDSWVGKLSSTDQSRVLSRMRQPLGQS